jgi:hypothetical protein
MEYILEPIVHWLQPIYRLTDYTGFGSNKNGYRWGDHGDIYIYSELNAIIWV